MGLDVNILFTCVSLSFFNFFFIIFTKRRWISRRQNTTMPMTASIPKTREFRSKRRTIEKRTYQLPTTSRRSIENSALPVHAVSPTKRCPPSVRLSYRWTPSNARHGKVVLRFHGARPVSLCLTRAKSPKPPLARRRAELAGRNSKSDKASKPRNKEKLNHSNGWQIDV